MQRKAKLPTGQRTRHTLFVRIWTLFRKHAGTKRQQDASLERARPLDFS